MVAKTVFIGIDGGELSMLSAMNQNGLLTSDVIKNLAPVNTRLLDRGWATIFTGKDASFHGGFYWRINDKEYTLTEKFNAKMYKAPPIWETVQKAGGCIGLIGVPTTYPAKHVNGFYIASGGGGTKLSIDGSVYPSEIRSILDETKYIFDVRFPDYVGKSPIRFVDSLTVADTRRWDTTKRLVGVFSNLNFLAVVFTGADRIQHFFWDRIEKLSKENPNQDELDRAIINYYQKLLSIVDEAITMFKDGKIIIASDHGFCGIKKRIMILPILENAGYLKSIKVPTKQLLKNVLKRTVPDRYIPYLRLMQRQVEMEGVWQIHAPLLDLKRSIAIPFNGLHGIYLNNSKNFQSGFLSEKEAELHKNAIREYLDSITDPDNKALIFSNISKSFQSYCGSLWRLAPDILFELPKEYVIDTSNPKSTHYIIENRITDTSKNHMPGQGHIGVHTSPAFFGVYEKGFNVKYHVENLSELYPLFREAF
jgi:predicted AlkP superfamily phosphohydrolase/phosphomutase